MASLTTKVLNSLGWIFSNLVVKNGIQFLRRPVYWLFLSAEDFGLNATVWIAISWMDLLKDAGFSNALVQRKTDLEKAVSVTFWANVVIHALVYLLVFTIAPVVALHYDEPRMTLLLRVTGLVLILRSLGGTNQAWLRKHFRFKVISLVMIAEAIVMTIVTIACAASGLGVWSFVWGTISSSGVRVILLWITCPLRIGGFDLKIAKEMFGFAKHMTLSSVTLVLTRTLPTYFVGRYVGLDACGYYVEAERLASMGSTNVTRMLGSVLFPAFSQIGDDLARLRKAWTQATLYTMVLILPLSLGLLCFSTEIFLTFFPGPLVLAIVPMMILALLSLIRGFGTTLGDVAKGADKPWILTRAATLQLIVAAPLLWFAVSTPGQILPQTAAAGTVEAFFQRSGGMELALVLTSVAITLTAFVSTAYSYLMCRREVGFRMPELREALVPGLCAGTVMVLFAFLAKLTFHALGAGAPLTLFVVGPLSAAVYGLTIYVFFPNIVGDMKSKMRRRKSETISAKSPQPVS